MPEGGVSPDIQASSIEQEVKYERRVLGESGDLITLNGKDILNTDEQIAILIGSDNPVEADKSKRYLLRYSERTSWKDGVQRPIWTLVDADSKSVEPLEDEGIPFPVGRDNQNLISPEEGQSRQAVSRKHLAILVGGEKVTILQRSHTNRTFIDAPTTSIVSTDLYNQSGTTK